MKPTQLMIREYQTTDLEAAMNIWQEASTLAHPFLQPAFVEKVTEAMRTIYLPNPDAQSWVYVVDQEVVAFISMIGNEIGGLFVHPENHGKGIGTSLVNYVQELYPLLEVEVFKANKIGKPFYDKYGFKLMKEYYDADAEQMILRMKYSY